MSNGTMTVNI